MLSPRQRLSSRCKATLPDGSRITGRPLGRRSARAWTCLIACYQRVSLVMVGLYTPEGRISIRNARFRDHFAPVDPTCECSTCRRFSAAYLHHLHRAEELLWFRLATIHNLAFILREMRTMRMAILDGSFAEQRAAFHARYHPASAVAAAANRARYRDRKSNAANWSAVTCR